MPDTDKPISWWYNGDWMQNTNLRRLMYVMGATLTAISMDEEWTWYTLIKLIIAALIAFRGYSSNPNSNGKV